MISSDREWHRAEGAPAGALTRLQALTAHKLPEDYLKLIAFSNGGEGPLPVQPLYFQLDDAETVAEALRSGAHEKFFPGFIIVGSNGAGEFIALDVRVSEPWPVVAIDMTNSDLAESVQPIAPDFSSFVELIGLEA